MVYVYFTFEDLQTNFILFFFVCLFVDKVELLAKF